MIEKFKTILVLVDETKVVSSSSSSCSKNTIFIITESIY